MFGRIRTLCLVILSALTLIWGFLLVYVRQSDIALMKQKVQAQEVATSHQLFSKTEQKRKGVVKEIWFTQEDNTRLHYRISSLSSLLTIKPDGNRFDLMEKLEKMKCWMQDKLYTEPLGGNAMQQVRFFAAEEGLYHYTLQEFLAQNVDLSLYRLNGHDLPKETLTTKPFLKGVATNISFAISGKNPKFEAKHFKAELNTLEEKK